MQTASQLKNLTKGKRFGHEQPKRAGPGRPRKKAWIDELDELASSSKEFKPLLLRAIRDHPIDVMYYLMGKPKEMVVLDHTMKAEITQQEVIDKAIAIRAEMEKQAQKPEEKPSHLTQDTSK